MQDRKDYKTPPGNIDLDSHHRADAKIDCRFTHGKARSPPELTERRPHLKLPATLGEWKKIDEELEAALPRVFPKRLIKRWSCQEVVAKFEAYVYDFIAQRVPQEETKDGKQNLSKTSVIQRIEAALAKNRIQKLHQKKHMKSLKKTGCFCGEVAKRLTRLWRKLLKDGNRLRRRLKQAREHAKQRRANAKFRADPHAFAKRLFNPTTGNAGILPTKERCEQYFPNLYKDKDRGFTYKPMSDMQRPEKPTRPLNVAPPTKGEFRRAVWSKRNAACPGRNGVNYLVYKRLPSAFEMLYVIICKAWDGDIPDSWAWAAVVLLFKDEDPTDPANYRPIALQSCSGKIYFSIWARRLEKFMTDNGYFKRSKQKGFLRSSWM